MLFVSVIAAVQVPVYFSLTCSLVSLCCIICPCASSPNSWLVRLHGVLQQMSQLLELLGHSCLSAHELIGYLLVVVAHLDARLLVTALIVEPNILFAAVEDCLVAALLLGNMIEGLDELDAKLLALLVSGDGNIFNVPNGAQLMDTASLSA